MLRGYGATELRSYAATKPQILDVFWSGRVSCREFIFKFFYIYICIIFGGWGLGAGKKNQTLTVAASPPLVEKRDWVQGQQTEISHVPEERKKFKSMRQGKNTK